MQLTDDGGTDAPWMRETLAGCAGALVVLGGPPPEPEAWQQALAQHCRPALLALRLPDDGEPLPAAVAKPVGAVAQAWVCEGPRCLPPVGALESLLASIGSGPSPQNARK